MSLNNPAGRLLQFLERARADGDQGQQALQVFARVLDTDLSKPRRVYARITEVQALPLAVKGAIESIPDIQADLYLSWVGPVHECLNQRNFANPFQTFTSAVDDNTLNLVRLCDQQLVSRFQPEIERQSLSELRSAVDELLRQAGQADLDRDLTDFVVRHADVIRCAIDDYALRGAEAIREGAERVVGLAVLNRDEFTAVGESKISKNYRNTMVGLLALAAAYSSGKELVTDVVGLLPGDVVEVVEEAETEAVARPVTEQVVAPDE